MMYVSNVNSEMQGSSGDTTMTFKDNDIWLDPRWTLVRKYCYTQ